MQSKERWAPVLMLGMAVLCSCDKKPPPPATEGSADAVVSVPSAVPASTLPTTDLGRLEPMATKVLTFCQNEDAEALVLMMAPSERDAAKVSFQPGGKEHEAYFAKDAWRRKAVESWDDGIGSIRIDGEEARAKFGEVESDAAVVVFKKREGVWQFVAIERYPKQTYETWGSEAK